MVRSRLPAPRKTASWDKIDEFAAELKDPATSDQERLYALQFYLHFVGDLHQPLHSSDNNDQGGNAETVKAVPPLPTSAGKSSGTFMLSGTPSCGPAGKQDGVHCGEQADRQDHPLRSAQSGRRARPRTGRMRRSVSLR